MRSFSSIATEATEIPCSPEWDSWLAAIDDSRSELPFTADDYAYVLATGMPVVGWEMIQATLCPLEYVPGIDAEDYPESALAYVADGYVYILYDHEELALLNEEWGLED